ncbi:MAG TPA: restriction endonuclease subunit S [Caldisericia bacterium]|nr:restriction endonuclease subunit S [Caldisericia bacterium]HXK51578.1 restriction endonuclease subunit S [Caldisericia bacterium]
MKYGLGENQLSEILDIFRKYPEVEEAILFGSRAIGTYKEASDIDIAIKGKDVSVIIATKIQSDLEDTYLPFFFDIISFPSITNQDLIKHINTKGISIYRAGWKKCKLGDVVENISERYIFEKNQKVVFLNTSDVYDGNVNNHELVDSSTLPGQAKKRISFGDVVFSEIRPINKHYAVIDFESSNYVVSTKLMVLRPTKDIDLKFFLAFLTSDKTLSCLQTLAEDRSGTFPQITYQILASLEIDLPPLHKQKEIASILSCLDDKIDLLHRQNKTLESIAQTLFHQWFIKEADEKCEFEILSKSCNIVDCLHSKKPEQVDLENSSSYLLQVYNIGEDGNIDLSNKFCVSESDYKEWTKRIEVKHGDIVISKTGRVGAMMQIPHYVTAGIGRNLVVIRPRKSVTKEFLKDLMFSSWMRDQIETNTSDGTILRSLHVKNIEQLKTPICKSEKINDYSNFIFPIHKKQENNLIQISTLKKKRNILMKVLLENKLGE